MPVAPTGDELEVLHVGLTIAQTAVAFGISQREVKEKVVGKVQPATALHKSPVRYAIKDLAGVLGKTEFNIEDALRNVQPSKLPPMLQDAFWKAQRNKLAYMEQMGQLWSTERVIEILGDMAKPIRMQILMMQQHVADETELSEDQRVIIQALADKTLERISEEVEKVLKLRPVPFDEHGPPLTEVAVMEEIEAREEAEDDDSWLS